MERRKYILFRILYFNSKAFEYYFEYSLHSKLIVVFPNMEGYIFFGFSKI